MQKSATPKPFWKTKTFWGAFVAAAAHVAVAPSASARVQAGVEGIGIVLSAAGMRAAISKNGSGE